MKRSTIGPLCAALIAIVVCSRSSFAANDDGVWTRAGKTAQGESIAYGEPLPARYETFLLNQAQLEGILARVPEENTGDGSVLSLPMPDGTLQRFRVEHSLVVEPGLLAEFPELGATYRGYGIDDPTASVRFDLLPSGFHAVIHSASGTFIVDPASHDTDNSAYVSFNKRDGARSGEFNCLVKTDSTSGAQLFSNRTMRVLGADLPSVENAMATPEVTSGATLRTYRLALAGTNEYCEAIPGTNTVANCLAAQVLIINRINGIYERDLSIHLNIIANNSAITFADNNNSCGAGSNLTCTSANDPYTNSDGLAMLDENQLTLDGRIGTGNYDIGHVFSTGGGGIAGLGVPCNGLYKAEGVTGLTDPTGDAFAIDFVAHEIGHQFGANHTFNTSCDGNRNALTAYEPGSGVTIMGYAGVCGTQDLALHSIDTFHYKSIEEIISYTTTNIGNGCAVKTPTNNTPPSVSVVGGNSFTIPKQTPFGLSATGGDVDGDTITYDWQEYDLGGSTSAVPNTDATNSARPIFRTYLPTSGNRVFPALTYILNNANVPPAAYDCGFGLTTGACLTGELLPAMSRTMKFQVIARDNRANGGGVNTATASVIVDSTAGPFVITSHPTTQTFPGGSPTAVTWNVANTTNAAVNAQAVDILLSTDGGVTFPHVLASATANDGTEVVTLPQVTTSTARIKVQGTGKIFFDISAANLSITATGVDISGKVFGSGSRGVTGITVTLQNLSTMAFSSTKTDRLGNYTFTGLTVGGSYWIYPVGNARFQYTPRTINVNNNSLTNENFTPTP